MAVLDPKKLLPSSKEENKKASYSNATRFLVPAKNVQYRDTAPVSPEPEQQESNKDLKKDILIIKEKVISIEDILKKSLDLQKKTLIGKGKDLENKRRVKKENILEQKKDKNLPGGVSIPTKRMGIFDSIKNFVTNTLLGFVLVRLIKYLPQIIEFSKKLTPAITFIESFVGGMANKLISFIEIGYGVYDKVRDTIKNIGGENLQKTFDQFSGQLNTFINLAIIAGMSTMGGTDFGLGKKGKPGITPKTGKTGTPSQTNTRLSNYLNRGKEAKLVERKFGNSAARYYEELRNSGKNSAQAFKEVKKRFQPRGLFGRQNIAGLAGEGQTAGQVGKRGLGRTATRFGVKTFGKGGAKIASGATKALGRFPIIGPLVDFAFRYFVLREPLGKATAGAVGAGVGQALGSWVGGTIGTVAGSVVPIIGNLLGGAAGAAIGGLLGGLIGDQLGVSLYETIVAYQRPEKIEGRAKGGQISTRGGKQVGGKVQRTFRRHKKISKVIAPPVQIGKDVGGSKVIEKVFTPENPSDLDQMSSLRVLKGASNQLKNPTSSIFGQIMGVGVDLIMGQKPSKIFYNQVGSTFGSLIQQLIDTNADIAVNDTARSILAMANGGIVPTMMRNDKLNFGEKVGSAISDMFQQFVEKQSSIILNSIRLESEKKSSMGMGQPGEEGTPLGEGETATGRDIMQGLISRGFTKEEAAAIVGNLWAESGFRTDAVNPSSGAFGLMQWLGGRKSRLQQFSAEKGKPATDFNVQLDYIKWELKGGNAYETEQFKKAMSYGDDVASKTRGFAEQVERAGAGELRSSMSKRIGAAQSVFGGTTIAGEPGRSVRGMGAFGSRLGSGSEAQKLIVELGRFLQNKQVARGSGVHENPAFGGVKGYHRGRGHYEGRAIDIGGWGGKYGRARLGSGFVDDQSAILSAIREWSLRTGKKPYLLHGDNDSGHWDHVHAEFKKGGYTGSGGLARLHGNEMVMNSNAVNFFGRNTFESMNAIGDKTAKIIKNNKNTPISNGLDTQTSYEKSGMTVVILPIHEKVKSTSAIGSGGGIPNIGRSAHIDNSIESALA